MIPETTVVYPTTVSRATIAAVGYMYWRDAQQAQLKQNSFTNGQS